MEKEQLWRIYADKNPAFEGTEPVTMMPSGLKKLFEQTWDQAFEAGKETAQSPTGKDNLDSIFGQFFRK